MRKIAIPCILLMAVFFLSASIIKANPRGTGILTGIVTDESGKPLKNVLIRIYGPAMMAAERKILTNEQGVYRIIGVPPGKGYHVEAALAGYLAILKTDIRAVADQTVRLNFGMLTSSPHAPVIIREYSILDVEKSYIGDNLDQEFIQNIPSDRTYPNILLILPGVSEDPNAGAEGNWNVHGASVRDNAYFIDGASVTDPATGTFGTRFNFDAIEEIVVRTGGYSAEIGQASGAVVNVVTKSGGNDFSGELNLYGITDGLNSPRRDVETGEAFEDTLEYKQVEPSFNLGGPIIRDRVWFFASYQYTWQNRTFNEYQSIAREWRSHMLFGKATLQVSEGHKLMVQYQADPAKITNLTQNPYITEEAQPRQDQSGRSFNAQWQSILNENTLVSLQGAFRRQNRDYTNKDRDLNTPPYDDRVWDPVYGRYVTWTSGNVSHFQLTTRDRFQVYPAVSYYKDHLAGTHDFKFGAEFEASSWSSDFGIPGGVSYDYRNGENYRKTEQTRILETNDLTRFSAYAQDAWSPVPGLTLNLGVRLDRESIDNEVEELWSWHGVAPRLGFAWDVLKDGKNVVRGFYGRFYAPIITQYAAGYSTEYATTWTWDWFPDEGVWVIRHRSGSPNQKELEDNITAPYTDEFSLGFEREILPDLAFGASFIYRKSRNFLEDWEINQYWDGLGGNTGTGRFDPGIRGRDGTSDFRFTMGNIDGETRYKGLELTLRKIFSHNWQLLASYVLSKAEGDVMGDFNCSSSLAPAWDTPAIITNQYGSLNHDQRHVFKVSGTYFFPLGFIAGARYTFATGAPYNHYYWHDGYQSFLILRDPRGQYRYPSRHNVDVRIEKTFGLPWGQLGILMDVFNLFNDDAVTLVREYGYEDDPDERFGEVWGRVPPRRVQLGVRFIF
jgi:hypothetical protein